MSGGEGAEGAGAGPARDGAPRIRVLGLGNVLMQDDAAGPHVVHALEAGWVFPPEVSLVELGTPGLDLMPWVLDVDALILVDALPPGGTGRAGEVRLYRRDDILRRPPGPRLSPHDPGVKEALLAAEFAGRGPREALLVGIVAESTGMGTGLSAAVRAAVPEAVAAVLGELGRLGCRPSPGPPVVAAPPWWEQAAT